jgi:hypothetical protein
MDRKNYDIKLGDMGYDLYVPYAQSCELMDVIEKGCRAMEADISGMKTFQKDIKNHVKQGDLTQEIADKLIDDRNHSIEKLEKLIEIGYEVIAQMNTV